jgi:hypothetical protein
VRIRHLSGGRIISVMCRSAVNISLSSAVKTPAGIGILCSDPCSAPPALSLSFKGRPKSSKKASEIQVCESFRQWWYATKNTQAIIRCKTHQTQSDPQCLPVLNPFQTQHVCLCHIRKTNRAIFLDRSNELPIQQYQTRRIHSPRNIFHRFQ